MDIKKWRTAAAYRFASVVGIAVGSALIVSACNQSPTATDSVGNETAVVGQTFATKKAAKVDVCHLDDEGAYHLINVSGNALSAHIAHGDGQPGDGTFDEACGLVVGPPPTITIFVPGEATGTTVALSCGESGEFEVSVIQAAYGDNCVGGGFSPDPNFSTILDETAHLAAACNGAVEACLYTIDHTVIGDAYFGCRKEYQAEYACVPTDG